MLNEVSKLIEAIEEAKALADAHISAAVSPNDTLGENTTGKKRTIAQAIQEYQSVITKYNDGEHKELELKAGFAEVKIKQLEKALKLITTEENKKVQAVLAENLIKISDIYNNPDTSEVDRNTIINELEQPGELEFLLRPTIRAFKQAQEEATEAALRAAAESAAAAAAASIQPLAPVRAVPPPQSASTTSVTSANSTGSMPPPVPSTPRPLWQPVNQQGLGTAKPPSTPVAPKKISKGFWHWLFKRLGEKKVVLSNNKEALKSWFSKVLSRSQKQEDSAMQQPKAADSANTNNDTPDTIYTKPQDSVADDHNPYDLPQTVLQDSKAQEQAPDAELEEEDDDNNESIYDEDGKWKGFYALNGSSHDEEEDEETYENIDAAREKLGLSSTEKTETDTRSVPEAVPLRHDSTASATASAQAASSASEDDSATYAVVKKSRPKTPAADDQGPHERRPSITFQLDAHSSHPGSADVEEEDGNYSTIKFATAPVSSSQSAESDGPKLPPRAPTAPPAEDEDTDPGYTTVDAARNAVNALNRRGSRGSKI